MTITLSESFVKLCTKVEAQIDFDSLTTVSRNRLRKYASTGVMLTGGDVARIALALRNPHKLPSMCFVNDRMHFHNMPADNESFWEAAKALHALLKIQDARFYAADAAGRLIANKKSQGYLWMDKEMRGVFDDVVLPKLELPEGGTIVLTLARNGRTLNV